jgi:hypothetical protein
MFGRKSPELISSHTVTPHTQKELAGRYASLFMICYQRRDISGMHITLTAFTHTLHALKLWENKKAIMEETRAYIMVGGFPEAEIKALDWLLHHYFEQPNDTEETALLNWYQALDDEWVLRKKLRALFPEKQNSELTVLIAAEQQKLNE